MVKTKGYVLRIAEKQWVDKVFDWAIYYTNLRRKWKPGQTVLFVSKTDIGDAVIGYGLIGIVYERAELHGEGNDYCRQTWKKAIAFNYVVRFGKPLPTKRTFLRNPKFRGRYSHGLPLIEEQVASIMREAELLQC